MPDFLSESDLQSIYEKIQDLQQRLSQLEQRNQTVIISGGKPNIQPQPLRITQEELVNIYNYAPQILLAYVTPVAVTAHTYTQQDPHQVTLEYSPSGHYWVVLTETEAGKSYWLLPHGGRRIDFNRLRSRIELLFDLQGDSHYLNTNFNLEKPAQLRILPGGTSWQLVEKGYIISGKVSPAQKILSEIENLRDSQGKIPDSFNSLLENIQNISKYNSEDKNINAEIKKIKESLTQVIDRVIEYKSYFTEKLNKTNEELEQKLREYRETAEKNTQLLASSKELSLTRLTQQCQHIENKIVQMDMQLAAKLQQQDKTIRYLKTGVICLFLLEGFLLAIVSVTLLAIFFDS
ncbi:MAG: hypothetical protein NZ901_08725 [Geminocystis sp.]|nr:hypothetical protein [Geminocystis sp.]HIK37304.1 hypothetical protein [Geminocystis sp. M7585_C2015_104]MCS7148259.1 hypothetical protein [Geminocystis sp.]MCX8077674.1 hypothetical protein [Geminocystis sp.]MDW8116566.1 hypothetical protein [Geminocystis sp.]